MKKLALLMILLLCPLTISLPAQQPMQFKVIINAANGESSSLTRDQIANLFLKKITRWKNGHRVLPADQVANAPTRELFSKTIYGKSVAAIKSYWQQKLFAGEDVPPPELDSDSTMINYVQSNADAIGYVSARAVISDKLMVVDFKP